VHGHLDHRYREQLEAALDERRQRIIHHRLVVHRLELFARHQREGYSRIRTASENDSFISRQVKISGKMKAEVCGDISPARPLVSLEVP